MKPMRYLTLVGVACAIAYPWSLDIKAQSTAQPAPPKYYSLSVDLEIDQIAYRLSYAWQCTQRWDALRESWYWSSSAGLIAKELPGGAGVVFSTPASAWCDYSEGQAYYPDVALVRDVTNASELEVFPGKDGGAVGTSTIVKSGVVHVLDAAAPSAVTAREKRLADFVNNSHYIAVIGIVIPELVWRKSEPLSRQLGALTELTRAEDLSTEVPPKRYFPETAIEPECEVNSQLRVINFMREGTHWVLDPRPSANNVIRYRLRDSDLPSNRDSGITITYKGKSSTLFGFPFFYDPSDRVLIRFTSRSRPFVSQRVCH